MEKRISRQILPSSGKSQHSTTSGSSCITAKILHDLQLFYGLGQLFDVSVIAAVASFQDFLAFARSLDGKSEVTQVGRELAYFTQFVSVLDTGVSVHRLDDGSTLFDEL